MKTHKIAVLTGDIVHSQSKPISDWHESLKDILGVFATAKGDWDIFRGDSFQLRCKLEVGLRAALYIRASLRKIEGLDARIALGIGTEQFAGNSVAESSGEAYIRSGGKFDSLGKRRLAILTEKEGIDNYWDVICLMGDRLIENWSAPVAEVIAMRLQYPQLTQEEIKNSLKKSRSTVSEALSRGSFQEFSLMLQLYEHLVKEM